MVHLGEWRDWSHQRTFGFSEKLWIDLCPAKGNTNTEMSEKKSKSKLGGNKNVNLEKFYLRGGFQTKSCAPGWKMTLCQIPRWNTIIQKPYIIKICVKCILQNWWAYVLCCCGETLVMKWNYISKPDKVKILMES